MPRGDGTGPAGMGPMTGRGAGFCAEFQVPGYANPSGRGARAFGGRRRGFRHMYYATGLPGWARFGYSSGRAYPANAAPQAQASSYTPDPEQEKESLKNQAKFLKQQLADIEERLSEIEEN